MNAILLRLSKSCRVVETEALSTFTALQALPLPFIAAVKFLNIMLLSSVVMCPLVSFTFPTRVTGC